MKYDYRLDLLRDGVKIGEARSVSVDITFKKNADVCRGMKAVISSDLFRMSPGISFDMFSDRIRPVLIRGGLEEFFGTFMVIANPQNLSDTGSTYDLEAYDETMKLKQAMYTQRTNYTAGTQFMTVINSILTTCGFTQIVAIDSPAVLPNDVEMAPGTTYLEAINAFLESINYQHVHTDSYGRIILQPNENRMVADHVYSNRIISPIVRTTDIYDLPNVLVGMASSPDRTPLYYVKENNDPRSAISIPKRGYRVVKTYNVQNIADQATLESFIDQKFFDASQITETVNVETSLEGDHEYGDTVQLKSNLINGLFNEIEWSVSFGSNGTMRHRLERKVLV